MKDLYKKVIALSISGYACAGIAADKVPTLGDVLKASNLSVTGYIDTSYTYLSGAGMFTSATPNRVFDRERKSFNLHMVDVAIGYQPTNGYGAFVQLDFGSDADITASSGTGAGDQVDVQEAYLQWTSGPLTIIGGKFATSAGAELIESPSNANFSRSILFGYAIPFTHTGMRASYTVNDQMTLIAGINNGWDVVKESASGGADRKTLELGVSANPTKDLALSAMIHSGEEAGASGNGNRNLLDLIASFAASDALSFVLNIDIASQDQALPGGGDAKWTGVAGYVNLTLNDLWRLALRAETFNDKDGFRTGIEQKWKEATVTLAYMPDKNVEFRGEVRYDKSNKDTFVQPDSSPEDNQYSVGLEAIYKF